MALIDVEYAKAHVKYGDDSDDYIEEQIESASAIVLDYLKLPADHWQDTGGNVVDTPPLVRFAVVAVLAAMNENRDGSNKEAEWLSPAVKNILHRYRDPALA